MRLMATYLAFDVLTVGYALVSYYLVFNKGLSDPTATDAHWSFLAVLLAISLIDLAVLRTYYFDPQAWRSANSST